MKSHLVILTPGFSSSENDTESIVFLQNLIKSINVSYTMIEITVCTFQFPFTSITYSWFGNDVIPFNGKNSRLRKILVWIKALKTLKKLHEEKNISGILCCWLTDTSLIGKKFAIKKNIPFLCWAPGQDVKSNNRYLNWLNLKENEFAVMSKNQAIVLSQSSINCNIIIENGIIPEEFTVYKNYNISFSIHVLGAGSLTRLKNYMEFINIIELVIKEFPCIYCEILGDGPQKDLLQRSIIEKKLQKNIKLIGAMPHPEVIKKMHQSLVFLHTSTYEGNSTVMLEAAYSGNYIVCKKETASYQSDLIRPYLNSKEASEVIIDILTKNTQKPAREMLSSMHERAKEIITHLKIN